MEEHSFHDRSSLSGNSGSLGAPGQKPKLQPVRVKALLETYGSDDDSEDRERDSEKSDEDSDDTDDCTPLPEDSVDTHTINYNNFPGLNSIAEATLEISPPTLLCANELDAVEKSKLTELKENLFFPENPALFNKFTEDKAVKTPGTSSAEGLKVYSAPPVMDNEKNGTDNSAVLSFGSDSEKRSKSHSPEPKLSAPTLLKEQEYKPSESRLRHSGLCYESRDRKNSYKSSDSALEDFSINHKKIFSNDSKLTAESSNKGNGQLQVQRHFETENTAAARSSNTAGPSYLVTDTPLKHTQLPSGTRPTPCHSHKILFVTPQNQTTPQKQIESDFQKNYAQTPATILSHWSQSGLQTPLTSQVVNSSGNPVVTSSSSKHELQRYSNVEKKSVRRPLAETMKPNPPLIKETVPAYFLETRRNSLHYTPAPKIEGPYRHSTVESNLELKENKSPNDNEQLNNEMPPKNYTIPDKGNLIIPRMIPSSLNQQMKERKNSEEVKDVAKNCPTRKSINEQPKILERVPIAPASDIQCSQKNEFLKVKNTQYRNLGLVGKGMSGKVYRVQNMSNDELRAIKFVDLSKLDKEGVDGCLEEIRMLHKLQAPCIIKMFDYEVKETSVYVVMELGDTDLSSLIKTNSVEKDQYFTLYYWRQMLRAVNHIHKNGVIHSDLKPGNFVLVKGALKLIDFGIASSINSDMTSVVKNSTTGTLNYISPEALTDIGGSPSQNAKHKIMEQRRQA
ncbi:probable serine/threonine-protein kinase mps1 isoform X2 [Belonocnema kinseyi]|uniref:probable serine/threonine-protein kinase mps1 isoform X2 n=1 Tax=Belonocnema kinseyi TaxID=2817044 RepID=UPI00143D921D|nr:probable serine/threonine-protein kinase mps1 isoform X2 [Belonocnema kinseyi]